MDATRVDEGVAANPRGGGVIARPLAAATRRREAGNRRSRSEADNGWTHLLDDVISLMCQNLDVGTP